MSNTNEFPESVEKLYLRHVHLRQLAQRHTQLKRPQAYLGLPSVEMLDLKLWKPYLGTVTAVERDPSLALFMYQTAVRLGIRDKTVIFERDLAEIAHLLSVTEAEMGQSASHLTSLEQAEIRKARAQGYDIVNLDFYGGFLYPNSEGESSTTNSLKGIVKHQARHRAGCILALWFNLRDTGKDQYLAFINDVLDQLEALHVDAREVREFYNSSTKVDDQPPALIRLRFCVPAYVQKVAIDDFEVRILGAWTYKTFYHVALLLEARKGRSVLGRYPPIDELKNLLDAPLYRLRPERPDEPTDWEHVQEIPLPAPGL